MRRISLGIAIAVLLALGIFGFWFFSESGSAELAPLVAARPDYPVVFTSRSNAMSMRAASVIGEGYTAPGQPQWQASEGRLRTLTPRGNVIELTWGKLLDDGSTIIDVMTPSVSPDGQMVVFAGRRADRDGGRFRIFRVPVRGGTIEQLTGGAGDTGCVALPPLRTAADGSRLSDEVRKQMDYDDIDPIELPTGQLVFASSRAPDLGGEFVRRATQIWLKQNDGTLRSLSANRANDRWPTVFSEGRVGFTLWSHQAEVISEDLTGLVRLPTGATNRPDRWLATQISPTGENFGSLVKARHPVWRGRPTFDGRLMFMTPNPADPLPFSPGNEFPENRILAIAASEPGRMESSPSALASGKELPRTNAPPILWLPEKSADGTRWSVATPGPMPQGIMIAASPTTNGTVTLENYGIYSANSDAWSNNTAGGQLTLTKLFDDPRLVDAEPVLAYARNVVSSSEKPVTTNIPTDRGLTLADGSQYQGPLAQLNTRGIFESESQNRIASGQTTDNGKRMVAPPVAKGDITAIAIYSNPRDRFDDATQNRIVEPLRKLIVSQIDKTREFDQYIPTADPTMLLGMGPDGKVASVLGAADSRGVRAKFYAYAGDHVSGAKPNGYTFCTGCHAGHSHAKIDVTEKLK
jgi:WD40-like Beta Propeller Repeat